MSRHVIVVARYFHPDESATSQLTSDLAFHLAKESIRVSVVTSRQLYDDASADLCARSAHRGVSIFRVGGTVFGRSRLLGRFIDYLSFYVAASMKLWRLVARDVIVIATTDPPMMSVPAALVTKLRGGTLVNWLQDVFPEVAESLGLIQSKVVVRFLKATRDASLRKSSANVVISAGMRDRLPFLANRVECIPNWALEEFDPSFKGGEDLRARWGLTGCFVVGYSGNMGRAHALECVVEAARLLGPAVSVRFLFVGAGAQKSRLQELSQLLGTVIFQPLQPRTELRASLLVPDVHIVSLDPRLDGFVFPSKFVGVIALGKPVISVGDPASELSKLVVQSGCGEAVSPEDIGSLAALIARLSTDRKLVDRYSQGSVKLWETSFRRDVSLRKWTALLTDLWMNR
jgi:colanic acid biosynthesis glycosyl transferase WcaI